MEELNVPPIPDVSPPVASSPPLAVEQPAAPPAEPTPPASQPPARRPTLSELALGGALIVGDNVNARLQVPPGLDAPAPRTLETVLRPATEWDTAPSDSLTTARHVTVGILTDVRGGVDSGARFLDEATDALGRSFERVTRPARRSRVMEPVRVRFQRYQQRGEQMMAGWAAQGQYQESRSRAVAEASLGGFVTQSVSDLTESDQIQVLVQQVVASQGTGLAGEIIREIRERLVSLDILLERRIGRAPAAEISAAPPFYQTYIHERPRLAMVPSIERTLAGHYAGFVSRVAAFFVDVTLLLIVISLATTFVNALVNLFNLDAFLSRFVSSDGIVATAMAAIAGLGGILLVSLYMVIAWNINGQTVGDILLGVRVVSREGGRVSFSRAMARMFAAYVSALALFIGILWILFDRRRQGWHDKLAGTVVVYEWPAAPDEQFLREDLGISETMYRI